MYNYFMGLRLNKVNRTWSSNLAYAIGLIVTDGCLYNDGRHISLTSKDLDQLHNFLKCLNINVKIGKKKSGYTGQLTTHVQFGDINFYNFLLELGLTANKTKTIGSIKIPRKYFFDFLRGCFDGDGSFFSYWDSRWKSSFMYYMAFVSASNEHIDWLRSVLKKTLKINGHITRSKGKSWMSLKYAKKESIKIIRKMYYSKNVVCLKRKRLKIEKALAIIGERI